MKSLTEHAGPDVTCEAQLTAASYTRSRCVRPVFLPPSVVPCRRLVTWRHGTRASHILTRRFFSHGSDTTSFMFATLALQQRARGHGIADPRPTPLRGCLRIVTQTRVSAAMLRCSRSERVSVQTGAEKLRWEKSREADDRVGRMALRVPVIRTMNESLFVGRLFLQTKESRTIGRRVRHHVICSDDYGGWRLRGPVCHAQVCAELESVTREIRGPFQPY